MNPPPMQPNQFQPMQGNQLQSMQNIPPPIPAPDEDLRMPSQEQFVTFFLFNF